MGDRRCCCLGCPTYSDDFNRANSTDLGDNWEECSGNWEIKDNELVANSAGYAIWKPYNPALRHGTMTVKIIDPVDGLHIRIYAFWEDCDDDSIAADLVVTSVGSNLIGTVSLVSGRDGTPMETSGSVDSVITSRQEFSICVDDEAVSARLTSSIYPVRATSGTAGKHFVLSNEGSTVATFDDAYQIEGHVDHPTEPECPACFCNCDGHGVPLTMTLTLSDRRGCGNIDGLEFELSIGANPCVWRSNTWDCEDPAQGDAVHSSIKNWYWELVGSGMVSIIEPTEFLLVLKDAVGNGILSRYATADSTCNPIRLIFEDFVWLTEGYTNQFCCDGYEDPSCPDWMPGPGEFRWCQGHWDAEVTE